MRILITGGAGFIGSHVADAYLALGHEVAVLDNLSTGSLSNVAPEVNFYQADITDSSTLKRIFAEFRPEVVSHHAAKISVIDSVENPGEDAAVNIMGSLNVLQQARECGTNRFIFASSGGAIYGKVGTAPVTEDHVPNPLSPYGLAKMAFERYLILMWQFGAPAPVVLRYANVYGPRQGSQGEAGVVSIFSRRLWNGEPCTIFGDGSMSRDYVFVEDVAKANCLALSGGDGGTFNIGTGKQVTTLDLYRTLKDLLRKESGPLHFAPAREGEVTQIALNCCHAQEILGWTSGTSLSMGLRQVVEANNPKVLL